MDELKLGQIIEEGRAVYRDAIHIAVAPVVAGDTLEPCYHVCLDKEGKAIYALPDQGVGIVDPFLRCTVHKGQRFWLYLYPGTITSLRHTWSHPAFTALAQAAREKVMKGVNE